MAQAVDKVDAVDTMERDLSISSLSFIGEPLSAASMDYVFLR